MNRTPDTHELTPGQALEKVLEILGDARGRGGQRRLAEACEVSEPAVGQWVAKGKVPPGRVLDIEAAVNGQVTRYQLRPDIFGSAPRDAEQDHAVA